MGWSLRVPPPSEEGTLPASHSTNRLLTDHALYICAVCIGVSRGQKAVPPNSGHFLKYVPLDDFLWRPGPASGASYDAPDTPSRLVRGYPLSIPHPLDAFGVSLSASRLSAFGTEQRTPEVTP